jgi:hypothetical protein
VVDVTAVRVLVDPLPDGVEHVAVDLEAFVTSGGVVEDANDVVYYLVYWDAWVFPSVNNTAENILVSGFLE